WWLVCAPRRGKVVPSESANHMRRLVGSAERRRATMRNDVGMSATAQGSVIKIDWDKGGRFQIMKCELRSNVLRGVLFVAAGGSLICDAYAQCVEIAQPQSMQAQGAQVMAAPIAPYVGIKKRLAVIRLDNKV